MAPNLQRQGLWLTVWSQPPVNANYLTVGYAAAQNDRLVFFGWLYNVNQTDITNAQVFNKMYFGSLDAAGARQVAHEFATDILARFHIWRRPFQIVCTRHRIHPLRQ